MPPVDLKSITCNVDEGDSGTFADRMLMEGDPFLLVEAMAIVGLAVGASEGYIYIVWQYPDASTTMSAFAAIDIASLHGWIGLSVLGSGRAFDLYLRVGAGAYICGEETAMLESLEGRRGDDPGQAAASCDRRTVRPYRRSSTTSYRSLMPPPRLAEGAEAFRGLGVGRSRGTQVFQLAGNVKHGGILETAFGLTSRRAGGKGRRGHGQRTAGAGRPGRWASWRLPAYQPVRSTDGLRGLRRPSVRWWATGASSCSTTPWT